MSFDLLKTLFYATHTEILYFDIFIKIFFIYFAILI